VAELDCAMLEIGGGAVSDDRPSFFRGSAPAAPAQGMATSMTGRSGNGCLHDRQLEAVATDTAPHFRHGCRCKAAPQSLQKLVPSGLG
jgi:hypothetical protein